MKIKLYILGGMLMFTTMNVLQADTMKFDYLSDVIYGISKYPMDYTKMLGADTTTYPLWPAPIPGEQIKIKDKTYEKGVGSPYGDIQIMLDGKYERFESDIGIQPGSEGIGTFRVAVDGKIMYESGNMTAEDDAKHVSVSLKGAKEMILSGHGVPKVNWADAKLFLASDLSVSEPVDMAPFARVAYWDPARTTGVSVFRLSEFPAEDVFTETDIAPTKGIYNVPVAANGESCIGLQWLERRRLTEFGIQFADTKSMPSIDGVRVEGWAIKDPLVLDGHSEWQGKWIPIIGSIEQNGDTWTYRFSGKDNRDISQGTYKIRWIFPKSDETIKIKNFFANTTSQWETTQITLNAEKFKAGKKGQVGIYNGQIVDSITGENSISTKWDLSKPLKLKIKYTAYRPWGYDRTVLRIKMPSGEFSVAIDDIINNKHIYVKDAGFYAASNDSTMTLAEYKESIKGKETVLQRVHQMPDQRFENAISKLYLDVQDRSPTMLSLAFDNRKAVVDKFGKVGVGPFSLVGVFYVNPIEITPQFGSGSNSNYSRSLDNEWMPIPHMIVEENGISYHQSVCVAPYDKTGTDKWLNDKPLCLIQYTIKNNTDKTAEASLKLNFTADVHSKKPAVIEYTDNRIIASDGEALIAAVEQNGGEKLNCEITDDNVVYSGNIPANSTVELSAFVPMEWEIKPSDHMILANAESVRKAAEDYWLNIMAPSMKINIPDKLLTNIIMASQPHCMIASRNEENGKYVDPWIASVYYCSLDTESHAIIRGMDMMGQHDYAERGYDFFIKRQNPAGYLSHGYTMIGTGQHIWFMSDHYRLTGDDVWWKRVSPGVARICSWITKQADKTKRLDPNGEKVLEYGLIPPGTVADWQDWGYIYAAQGYYYAGLAQASKVMSEAGDRRSEKFKVEAEKLRDEIRRAYKWTQARTPVVPLMDGTWIPDSPFQLLKPGPCEQFFPNYSLAWIYDVEIGSHHLVDEEVFAPFEKQVQWMADYLEDVQFMKDYATGYILEESVNDWFDRAGYPKAQPYYGRYPELCAKRDDVKAFVRSYFNQLAPMYNREDLSFYENPGASVWNKTHETGHFLQQTHLMFLTARDNDLWLAPFVTNNWMKDGMVVEIKDAPSFFGKTGYRIESHVNSGYIEANVYPPDRKTPERIVIRLRHPDGNQMKKVFVDGKNHKDFDPIKEIVRIKPTNKPITIKAEYGD